MIWWSVQISTCCWRYLLCVIKKRWKEEKKNFNKKKCIKLSILWPIWMERLTKTRKWLWLQEITWFELLFLGSSLCLSLSLSFFFQVSFSSILLIGTFAISSDFLWNSIFQIKKITIWMKCFQLIQLGAIYAQINPSISAVYECQLNCFEIYISFVYIFSLM